jgi:hypothetical protein
VTPGELIDIMTSKDFRCSSELHNFINYIQNGRQDSKDKIKMVWWDQDWVDKVCFAINDLFDE